MSYEVVDLGGRIVTETTPVVAGPPGQSAYEIAVKDGFVGTEAEWIASLTGPAGSVDTVNGKPGPDVTLAATDVGAETPAGAQAKVDALGGTLGDAASRNVGNTAGTVAAGDDARFEAGGGSALPFPVSRTSLEVAAFSGMNTSNDCQCYLSFGSGTISKIGVAVQTSSGNIAVAVYAGTGIGRGARPDARAATSGSVPCPAVGYAEVALDAPIEVTAYSHWLALGADNATAKFAAGHDTVTGTANDGYAAGLAAAETAFPPPASISPANLRNRDMRTFTLIGVA